MSLEIKALESEMDVLEQSNRELHLAQRAFPSNDRIAKHPHSLALSTTQALSAQDERIQALTNENDNLKRMIVELEGKIPSQPFTNYPTESMLEVARNNSFSRRPSSGYNIPELLRICRTIIAKKGVFTLTTSELKVVHCAVYTAAMQKDPIKKSERAISYDIESGKEKIEYLQSELTESRQILKQFSKPKGDFNIIINTPVNCTQTQVYNEGYLSRNKKVARKPL